MHPPDIHNILSAVDEDLASANRLQQDAESYVLHAKASAHDLLLQALRITQGAANHARNALYVSSLSDPRTSTAPAFSPEPLRAMEELDATTKPPATHDPLDAPAAQPAVTTTPDPLDAPRPRRGGRRSRGSEGSPQPEAAPETTPQPEPQPDDLDLPGEPLSEPAVEAVAAPETGAAPAPEGAPSADPVAALFGTPGDDFDPLA
jgi:hypothetical protein